MKQFFKRYKIELILIMITLVLMYCIFNSEIEEMVKNLEDLL